MSKIPWQNLLAELSENTCNKYISSKSAGLQLATYFHHNFIFCEFFFTLGKPISRITSECSQLFFFLTA